MSDQDFSGMEDPFADMADPFAGGDEFAGMDDPFADMDDPFAGPDLSRSVFPEEGDPAAGEGELTWEDHGRSIMAGGAEVGAGMGWLADRAGEMTGIEALEKGGEALQKRSQESADWWRGGLSDYANQVNQQQFLKEDEDSITGYGWGDAGLDKVKLMLGQSLLGTAAGMGAGAAATAGLKVLPGVSQGVAATLGYSAGEAFVAAPSSGAAAEEEVRQMTDDDLSGHVEYQALLLTDTPPEEAKEVLARAAGGEAAMMTAISTAILSSPFGKALDEVVGGEAGSMMGGLVKGAATETAQEAVQSGAEQASVNAALLANADAGRSLMQDVPEAIVGGAAAGAAMGGAMGAAGGYSAGKAEAAQRQVELDHAAQAAAEEARARGGDDLDAEIARQQVYEAGEFDVAMPTDASIPPDAGEDITFNPFQETFREPIQTGPSMAQDGFADDNMLPYAPPETGGLELAPLDAQVPAQGGIDFSAEETLSQKAGAVEAAMEQHSYDQLGPNREPLAPVDDLGDPAIPAREEVEQAQLAGMEQTLAEAQKAVPERPKGNQKAANEEMEILQAIASSGGLSRAEAEAQGIDPAAFDTRSGGISRVFTNKGQTFDQMAEKMAELGFQGENYSANELVEQVTRALGGEEVYSQNSKTAPERAARLAEVDQIEQAISQFQSDSYEDENDQPKGATWAGADDPERLLTYTVHEAELAGVDEFTVDYILDNAATPEEAEQSLREKITNVKKLWEQLRTPQQHPQNAERAEAAPSGPGPAQEGGDQEDFQLEIEQDGTSREEPAPDAPAEPDVIDNTQEFQQRQIDVDDTIDLDFTAQPSQPADDTDDQGPAAAGAKLFEGTAITEDDAGKYTGDSDGITTKVYQDVHDRAVVMEQVDRRKPKQRTIKFLGEDGEYHADDIETTVAPWEPPSEEIGDLVAQIEAMSVNNWGTGWDTSAIETDDVVGLVPRIVKDPTITAEEIRDTMAKVKKKAEWNQKPSIGQAPRVVMIADEEVGSDEATVDDLAEFAMDTFSRGIDGLDAQELDDLESSLEGAIGGDGIPQESRDLVDMLPDGEQKESLLWVIEAIDSLDGGSLESAAHEAATSPENDLPEPTQGQKEAGNYKKGHVTIAGLDISIENPKGSTRTGTDPDGAEWSHEMQSHYGYIKRTEGADGDQVDVFIGSDINAPNVYVIDQNNKDGSFDEHKVMLGFPDQAAAEAGYLENYDDNWELGPVTELTTEGFKEWLKGDTTAPVADITEPTKAEGVKLPTNSLKNLLHHLNAIAQKEHPAVDRAADTINERDVALSQLAARDPAGAARMAEEIRAASDTQLKELQPNFHPSRIKSYATELEKGVARAESVPAVQGSSEVMTEADASRFNNNTTFLKGAVEELVGNDPGRVSRIQAAIERGASDGAVIKAAGISSFNKTKVKASDNFPGDVRAKGQTLEVTDRRGDTKTKVVLSGKDLAKRLREVYAPAAEEFALGTVDQTLDTDLLDVGLNEQQAKIAERVAKNLEGKTKNEMAIAMEQIGAPSQGLTEDAMRQRLAIVRIVMDDMQQYESLEQWNEAIGEASEGRQKALILEATNILIPNGSKHRTDIMFVPNTALLQKRLGKLVGGMVERTESEQAAYDEKQAKAKASTATTKELLQTSTVATQEQEEEQAALEAPEDAALDGEKRQLRQMNKRLSVLDDLLGCLIS